MLRQLIFCLALMCFSATVSCAVEMGESDISRIMKKAREDAEKINLPVNRYQEDGMKAAEKTSKLFHSPAFQERIQCEQQRLEKEVFADYTKPWKRKVRQTAIEQKAPIDSLAADEKVYLFISSSIPDETVHVYIVNLDKVADPNVSLVMRGLVGGITKVRVKKGQSYFSRIMKKELDCPRTQTPCERYQVPILLKSSLFTKYGITRVPAVAYEHDDNIFLIQGDAGLDYLLEKINREAKSTGLASLIKKIRGTL
jgi:hypothetical protein